MSEPLVTVAFTTYNVARFLPDAFDAVLAQDLVDFEVVVCDNRSTDGTWEICERYAVKDDRFRIFQNEENIGESANLARTVSLAQGKYFRLTAHDDLCAPTLLRECVQALAAAGPGAVLAYPQTTIIDEAGTELGAWPENLDLRARAAWRRVAQYAYRWNLCNQVFGVIRTEQLRRTGLLRPYLGGDVTMLTELSARGAFVEVPKPLFYRRMHSASTLQSGRNTDEVLKHLEPSAVRQRRPRRRPTAGLTSRTVAALLTSDLSLATRVSCAVAYPVAWWVRRSRVVAGRAWRRALRRPLPTAPWESDASRG